MGASSAPAAGPPSYPYVALVLEGAASAALEDWILEILAEAPDGGGFLGGREERRPGEAPRLVLSFATEAECETAARRLADGAPAAPAPFRIESGIEPPRDWVAEVAATVHAIPLGREYQALPGEVLRPLPSRTPIRVPRSQVFGTGEHASTRLAARLLERAVEPGEPVLDLGTGTGILAALAGLAGAAPVVALDSDPAAAATAARTLRAHALPGAHAAAGELRVLRPGCRFAVIAANLERDTILDLLPDLAARTLPGGHLILSGLLVDQAEQVAAAARAWGLVLLEAPREGEWAALDLTPRAGLRPRVLASVVEERVARLPAEEWRHLRSRRAAEGESVEVLDGRGQAWSGRIAGAAIVDLEPCAGTLEPGLEVDLWQAVTHPDAPFEAIVRGAVELGAASIVPVIAERSQGRRGRAGESPARWQRIAAEAAKQCGRAVIPEVHPARRLSDLLAVEPGEGTLLLLLDPAGRAWDLLPAAPPRRVRLLIGPEGGLTSAERAAALGGGFVPCRLGPRILRVETAALAGLTLVLARWADLGRPRRPEGPRVA